MTLHLGVLGGEARARFAFARGGAITPASDPRVTVTWWIGAADGWHEPETDSTTRFRRPGVAPSYETAVRVPSGDFVQRAYAVATPSGTGAIAVDFENTSRAPCSVAVFVDVTASGRLRLRGDVLWLDDTRILTFGLPPRLWVAGADAPAVVRSGDAVASEPAEWDAPTCVAVLAPVAHGVVLRTALTAEPVDVRALADPSAVERGWRRQLDRGVRTELPDPLQTQVDQARADLLLAPRSGTVVAALEDWGFDAEAAAMWSHLTWRARRAARRRPDAPRQSDGVSVPDASSDPAGFLLAVRRLLAREEQDRVELLPGFRPEWLGQHLAAHDLPLRAGPLSFAIRWHGARPALLWEQPRGIHLRAPALDPAWETSERAGEVLLAAPPAGLLGLGTTSRAGERITDPGSFQ